MAANIILSKESSAEDIKRYFEAVLKLSQSDDKFPINLDDVWMLVYTKRDKATEALKENFFEGEDFYLTQMGKVIQSSEIQNGIKVEYKLTTSCMEYFIARKVRPVFEVYHQVFHKVANGQINLPTTKELALMVIKAEEEKERLMLENEEQKKKIVKLEEDSRYLNQILNSKNAEIVSVIAQDYGMKAPDFNKLLNGFGIQYKKSGTWFLYSKYLKEGYVTSSPFTFPHSDGRIETKNTTKWTRKGMRFLYYKLKEHGILPLIERNTQNE